MYFSSIIFFPCWFDVIHTYIEILRVKCFQMICCTIYIRLRKSVIQKISFLKKLSLTATAHWSVSRTTIPPPQSFDFFWSWLNKCTNSRVGSHWPILIKFDMLALFGLLYNIYRKLEGTSIINARSVKSKLYWFFNIHMVLTYGFLPDFFPL